MTNLSDLFPAGAGKQVSFVADGAISAAGKPVILTAAGKAAPIVGSGAGLGSTVQYSGGTVNPGTVSTTYDPDEQKIVTAYTDSANSNYGTAVIGTITSSNVLSYGTPVVFASASSYNVSTCYDTTNNKVVITFQDATYATAIVGTVSGTSISFGTETAFTSDNTPASVCIFEPNSGKVVVATRIYTGTSNGEAFVGTVSGTSISFGSANTYLSGSSSEYISMSLDPDNSNQILMVYRNDGAGGVGTAIVAAVSGTSMTFGTPVVFSATTTYSTQTVYDTVQNKHVVFYSPNGAGEYYSGMVIVATTSGTDVTFGTAATWKTGIAVGAASQGVYSTGACWDSINNRIPIAYCFHQWDDATNDLSYVLYATLDSGGTVTFSDETQFDSGVWTRCHGGTAGNFAAFDTNQGSMAYAWTEAEGDNQGYALAYQPATTNLTATNFIGISDAAILDTASGNITIKGGIAATGLTSLTPGSDYYAQTDGTISTSSSGDAVKIGKAMSATSINLEYQS